MAKTIAFMNQKGGVGKTTTTVNIGAIIAHEFAGRVLLVDLDPQGNLSDHVGLDPNATEESLYNVLLDGMDPRQAIRRVHGFETLPANIDLSGAEIELAQQEDRYSRLRSALATVQDQYDYILLDCPPSLGILTVSGLAAADAVVVTMLAEYMALRGISQILRTVELVRDSMNPALSVEGVVFCCYDARTMLSRQVKAEVEKFLPGKVFATAVRRNVRLAEAPSCGMPITEYDAKSAGAEDYRAVTKEFLDRFGKPDVAEVEVLVEPDILAQTPIIPEDVDGRGKWQRQPLWER